jgi:Lon protease-like protein
MIKGPEAHDRPALPEEMPLFPLKTVLFPGGLLPLRIFEPRYVDMLRSCMRQQADFGVVLIKEGSEAGANQVRICEVGTTAHIVDFSQLEDGLLGIVARGERRFRILNVRTQKDGLHLASVERFEPDDEVAVPEEFLPLVDMLKEALPQLGEMHKHFALRYHDAAWVAGRVLEILPLQLADKQLCLEMEGALQRLQQLKPLLKAAENKP